ncbi:hypothetical protein EV421DRAFT_2035266, partial [Armillaria borealis]
MAYDFSISRLPLKLTLYPYFHPTYIFKMCRRRHVRNVYLRCRHTINLPEQIVRCEESNCKFSHFHPK